MHCFGSKVNRNSHVRTPAFGRQGKRPARGFTLLEVVIGTVLLASLVVGVVVSTGAHQRKILFARQRLEALQLADDLLTAWNRSSSGVPLSGSGALSADGTLGWATRVVAKRELCGVPVHVVRLGLFRGSRSESVNMLCSVDIVVNASAPSGTP